LRPSFICSASSALTSMTKRCTVIPMERKKKSNVMHDAYDLYVHVRSSCLCTSHAHHANVITNFGDLARGHATLTRAKEIFKCDEGIAFDRKLRLQKGE